MIDKMSKIISRHKIEDAVERDNPGLVYCDIDPKNPRIWTNREHGTIIKAYILSSRSRPAFIKRLVALGYTDSVSRYRSLVRLSDRNNQSEGWFCRNCSIEFNNDDEQVSHRQKLSIPSQDTEPCVTTIQYDYNKDVAIAHEPELHGGFAALAKRGTIRFTSYEEHIPK
jgi:hypothetical protein